MTPPPGSACALGLPCNRKVLCCFFCFPFLFFLVSKIFSSVCLFRKRAFFLFFSLFFLSLSRCFYFLPFFSGVVKGKESKPNVSLFPSRDSPPEGGEATDIDWHAFFAKSVQRELLDLPTLSDRRLLHTLNTRYSCGLIHVRVTYSQRRACVLFYLYPDVLQPRLGHCQSLQVCSSLYQGGHGGL